MSDEKKDFTVKLGEKALEAIVLLSNATEMTENEILMNALGFYMWAYTEWKDGKKIGSITKEDDGDLVQFIRLAFMENNKKYN